MQKLKFAGIAMALAVGVAGCGQNINPTDIDRAAIGAATGATIAHVAGKDDSDVLKGAAAGAAAGAICNDVGICR